VTSDVFSPFKEYSLCGYKSLREIPLVPAVGVRSGLPVRRHNVHASEFKYKAMYSCTATAALQHDYCY